MRQSQLAGTRGVLADAYERTPGEYVAFLDESFEIGADRQTFYLLAAVIVHRNDLDTLRDGLRDEVGTTYWHTTEAILTDEGRKVAIRISSYLGDENGSEVCLVSCKAPVDGSGDSARQMCFAQLAAALCQGAEPLPGPVHLLVAEKRATSREQNFDEKIVKDLRSDSTICRSCRLVQASPRDEMLLWLPDLVASAVRRSMTHAEEDLLDPIRRIVRILHCP